MLFDNYATKETDNNHAIQRRRDKELSHYGKILARKKVISTNYGGVISG